MTEDNPLDESKTAEPYVEVKLSVPRSTMRVIEEAATLDRCTDVGDFIVLGAFRHASHIRDIRPRNVCLPSFAKESK